MPSKKKIYCKHCKYLHHADCDNYSSYYCAKITGEKDSAMNRYKMIIDDYEEYNKNNDCKYFEKDLMTRIFNYFKLKKI